MEKNRYKLKENITLELLKEMGFTNHVPNHLYYRIHLCRSITLNITIPFINNKVDLDNLEIRVLCEEDLQPYNPFYQANGYGYLNDRFLDIIILRYNQEMDELVKKGIFEKVNKYEYFSSFIEKYSYLIDETIEPITWPNIDEGDIPRQPSLEELVDVKKLKLNRENRRK